MQASCLLLIEIGKDMPLGLHLSKLIMVQFVLLVFVFVYFVGQNLRWSFSLRTLSIMVEKWSS